MGPYEVLRHTDRYTFCVMSDNSVTQRHYTSDSDFDTSVYNNKDLASAFEHLEKVLSQYREKGFTVNEPHFLGKRQAPIAPVSVQPVA